MPGLILPFDCKSAVVQWPPNLASSFCCHLSFCHQSDLFLNANVIILLPSLKILNRSPKFIGQNSDASSC